MEFERIKKELETHNPIVIEAIMEILKAEEKKIGLANPVRIKDDIRRIFDRLGKNYDFEKD